MKMRNYFSPERFWLLLKLELFKSRRAIAMTFVITFGLLFFVGMLLSLLVEGTLKVFQHHENYASSMLIGGFILTSLAFNDLGNPLKRYGYLTLPVSALEKVICMWLLTSVGWILLFTIAYTSYTLIANPVGQLVFSDVTFERFNPFDEFAITTIRSYFVLQGIFLVGAAYFRGYALGKTVFVLVVFALFCFLLLYLFMADIFLQEHECPSAGGCEFIVEIGKHTAWKILAGFFWWGLAPLCWLLTYLGLKEQEV